MRLRPKYVLFGVIGLMFAFVFRTSEWFLLDSAAERLKDPEWMHISSFKWWLLPHGIAGACALILGPMQFSDRLRGRYPLLHRTVGRIYVVGTCIAAPLGVWIQYLNEPLGFSRSFTIETVLQGGMWAATTLIAFGFILAGKTQQHRIWMTRSFGTGPMIFMEVRVIFALFNVQDPHAIEMVVWGCTASSIFIADAVLQVQETLKMRRPAPARVQRPEAALA